MGEGNLKRKSILFCGRTLFQGSVSLHSFYEHPAFVRCSGAHEVWRVAIEESVAGAYWAWWEAPRFRYVSENPTLAGMRSAGDAGGEVVRVSIKLLEELREAGH